MERRRSLRFGYLKGARAPVVIGGSEGARKSPMFCSNDHRWRRPLPLGVDHDCRIPSLHRRHGGVRGAKIDVDDLLANDEERASRGSPQPEAVFGEARGVEGEKKKRDLDEEKEVLEEEEMGETEVRRWNLRRMRTPFARVFEE
ncbi:uncharacterized protein A4U43_C07F17230 [Asparagus officinalis]|uniref:Uncharacterized protein n=1 Tax=Asparagus officinalis TaxID=4686 RepID=A0A5P1EEL0_ASPOF|nr:uncharacterized protein A4U43_C07F17230 [Asparagus officinalis]